MPETIWLIIILILALLAVLIFKITPIMFIMSAYIALYMNKNKYPFDEQVLVFIVIGILFTIVLEPAAKYIYNKVLFKINKKYKRKKKIIKVESKKKKNKTSV